MTGEYRSVPNRRDGTGERYPPSSDRKTTATDRPGASVGTWQLRRTGSQSQQAFRQQRQANEDVESDEQKSPPPFVLF